MSDIFTQALKEREINQEAIKAANGLEAKKIQEQIHLSIPADCKQKFVSYCEKNYITPSAQLRQWINRFC